MKNFIIPLDKANHIIYGILIYLSLGFLFKDFYSLIITFGIGLLKEIIFDKILKKGNPELLDFICTITLPLIIFIRDNI